MCVHQERGIGECMNRAQGRQLGCTRHRCYANHAAHAHNTATAISPQGLHPQERTWCQPAADQHACVFMHGGKHAYGRQDMTPRRHQHSTSPAFHGRSYPKSPSHPPVKGSTSTYVECSSRLQRTPSTASAREGSQPQKWGCDTYSGGPMAWPAVPFAPTA